MKKKIIITGASRGLGFFMAKKYLEDGETVFAGAREIHSPLLRALQSEYPNTLIPFGCPLTYTKVD